ncbi:DeoR/GlpR family DNA-binding transcription regulator [Oceanobacillus jeddahense]|uniref:Lactose phosphotransferase system repressor n=1 Tax=Oceanobacillus jeddahense TaxID=1462527 RepID=A0ABY5JYE0_9BACI|nr:DeoR/GlpR family DNA-binding transcription regulator [Oceanobacillus jeddahense]UUI04452.1 DeoR/GlpR family DNA-binding transcription regulator [Oceanobacillus jeddahense]
MNKLKEIRQSKILQLLDEKGFINVNDTAELLNVTKMTIRRDLLELEKQGEITRVHGGAKKITKEKFIELSHLEKKTLNVEEKKYAAKKAAELIEENDTVFIGPGTTTEFISEFISVDSATIITNSISIFNTFQNKEMFDVVLVGGRLRERTKTFVGYFTSNWIKDIKVQKSFIGTNGIFGNNITTADEEEGALQRTIIGNSHQNYIVSDSSKFGVEALQVICPVNDVTGIITDKNISKEIDEYYKGKIIN